MLSIIIIVICVAADQLTKYWAIKALDRGNISIPLIKDVFHFTYTENTGSAFGLFQNMKFLLVGVTSFVLIVLLYLLLTGRFKYKIYRLGWTLIIAGGFGNLIDRIFRGYVVDFLHFKLINFAIFNVADICVTVGAVLVIIHVLFLEKDEKKASNLNITENVMVLEGLKKLDRESKLENNTFSKDVDFLEDEDILDKELIEIDGSKSNIE